MSRYELSKWNTKPILMDLVFKTDDKTELKEAINEVMESDNINEDNLFDYIHLEDVLTGKSNKELLVEL